MAAPIPEIIISKTFLETESPEERAMMLPEIIHTRIAVREDKIKAVAAVFIMKNEYTIKAVPIK